MYQVCAKEVVIYVLQLLDSYTNGLIGHNAYIILIVLVWLEYQLIQALTFEHGGLRNLIQSHNKLKSLPPIKMNGGTPEVRSDNILTNGPIVQWSNGPMDQWTNGPM